MAAEGADEEFDALPVVPLGDKKLRACLVTGLVKTEDQVRGTRYHLPRKIYREHFASSTHPLPFCARSFTARATTTCRALIWPATATWSTSAPLPTLTGARRLDDRSTAAVAPSAQAAFTPRAPVLHTGWSP